MGDTIEQRAVLHRKEKKAFAQWVEVAKEEANKIDAVTFRTVAGKLVRHPVGVVRNWWKLPHEDKPDAFDYFEVLSERILSIYRERCEDLIGGWQDENRLAAIARRHTVTFFRGTENRHGKHLHEYESEASTECQKRYCETSTE